MEFETVFTKKLTTKTKTNTAREMQFIRVNIKLMVFAVSFCLSKHLINLKVSYLG